MERVVAPFGAPVGWKGGNVLGDEEAAVGSEAFEDYIFEGELGSFSQREFWCLRLGGEGWDVRRRSRRACSGSAARLSEKPLSAKLPLYRCWIPRTIGVLKLEQLSKK